MVSSEDGSGSAARREGFGKESEGELGIVRGRHKAPELSTRRDSGRPPSKKRVRRGIPPSSSLFIPASITNGPFQLRHPPFLPIGLDTRRRPQRATTGLSSSHRSTARSHQLCKPTPRQEHVKVQRSFLAIQAQSHVRPRRVASLVDGVVPGVPKHRFI
jgi:hypothetical protein